MNAIILFTSCYLPENTVENYEYIMDNLFRFFSAVSKAEFDLLGCSSHVLTAACGRGLCTWLQVHCGDSGPDGLGELPAGLPVCHGPQKQAACYPVAPPVLHVHRQEVGDASPHGSDVTS